MGHVYIKIPKALIEVEKVIAAAIGGLETLAESCTGCVEDYVLGVWCLVTCNSGLVKRGRQHWRTAILVVLHEYRFLNPRVKTHGLAFIGCTWQWPC